MRYFAFLLLFVATGIVGMSTQSAHALTTRADESVEVRDMVNDDLATGGTTIRIIAPISGELFAAGSRIEVTEAIGRSAYVAGESVTVSSIGHNLFAAGSTVTVQGTIEHDAYIVAARVILDETTVIKGTLRIWAATVELRGTINGDVVIHTDTVTSNATVGGNVSLATTQSTFSGGSIAGNLNVQTNAPISGLDTVRVAGTTTTEALPEPSQFSPSFWLMGFLATLVSGAALLLLLPRKVATITQHVQSQWGEALVWGSAVTILVPLISFPILLTGVGTPIALISLMLYVAGFYLAGVMAQIVVGAWVLKRFNAKYTLWGALVLGVLIITLLSFVPLINWVIGTALAIGVTIPVVGAVFLWWREMLQPGGRG